MRKENSITDQAFNAINAVGVGNTFTVSDIYNRDMACYSMYGQRQRLYDILCMLNKTGLISRVKRGTYKLEFPIPDVLTYTDIESYNGYTLYYNFSARAERKRKQNPFDIDAYKASFSTQHSCGNVVDLGSDREEMLHEAVQSMTDVKFAFEVNMKTGEVKPVPFFPHVLSQFNVFEDEDSAKAFAEGIVPAESFDECDDELDNALEEIENEIATTLLAESSPESDPEYKCPVTEEEFNAIKDSIVNLDLTEERDCEPESPGSGPEFVKILIKPGTQVYIIEQQNGYIARMIKDVIDDCEIHVNREGVRYDFNTCEGYNFGKDALSVTVFTDKTEAVNALSELL